MHKGVWYYIIRREKILTMRERLMKLWYNKNWMSCDHWILWMKDVNDKGKCILS